MIQSAMIRPRIASSRCCWSEIDSDVIDHEVHEPEDERGGKREGGARGPIANTVRTTANPASERRAIIALEWWAR